MKKITAILLLIFVCVGCAPKINGKVLPVGTKVNIKANNKIGVVIGSYAYCYGVRYVNNEGTLKDINLQPFEFEVESDDKPTGNP